MSKSKENKKKDELKDMEQNARETPETEEVKSENASDGNAPSELEILQGKFDDLNDKYLRLQAEFDNFRRRTAKEKLDMVAVAGKDIIIGLLPTLDDCERALKALKQSDASASAIEGTELIYNKLFSFLKSRGLESIEAMGTDFNTDFHEAVAQIPAPSEEQKNKVIDVIQQGYTLNGTIVRFAKVVVGI